MEPLSLHTLCKQFGVGLTGGIATGKSTVGLILRELGEVVIDADALAREVVRPGRPALQEITKTFGSQVLQEDGQLDRKKMADLVFGDPKARIRLESIAIPQIAVQLSRELETQGLFRHPHRWFYEASLLFEKGRSGDFGRIWVCYCPEPVQIQRAIQRDETSEGHVRNILAAQMPLASKLQKADLAINTHVDMSVLRTNIKQAVAGLSTPF